MTAATDVGARLDEIYEFVCANDLGNAIKRLLDLAREFSHVGHQNEARVLSMSRRELEDRYSKRFIKYEEYSALRENLAHRLLELARSVFEHLESESSDA